MTAFTESFYKAYFKTNRAATQAEESWKSATDTIRADSATFVRMLEAHNEQVKLLKRLVQLENLCGAYCVQYTVDAKTEEDKAWVEAECLEELSIILEETK